MSFLWLPIGDEPGPNSRRGYMERNAIALLSNYGKDPLDRLRKTGWVIIRIANASENPDSGIRSHDGRIFVNFPRWGDDKGRVYGGDYENNSIRQRETDGEWKTIAHDPRILWPDTLSVAVDGYLYFTANQLHRQPQFHEGQDLREKPYTLFRIKIDAGPVILK